MNSTRMISALVLSSVMAVAVAETASAKDWIEKVAIATDGIDTVPIEVRADKNGYKSIKSQNHKFLLRIYARATKGERIVAGRLSFTGSRYVEGTSSWHQDFEGSAIGNGGKRELKRGARPIVPVRRIHWYGADPVQACKNLLKKKTTAGKSKGEVLGKSWKTSVKTRLYFDAVAARKKKAQSKSWSVNSSTWEKAGMIYNIPVRCLAAVKRAG